MSGISQENYEKVLHLFKYFDCKSAIQYLLLYCIIDTFLISQIFEHFRRYFLNWCNLDPALYVGLPGVVSNLHKLMLFYKNYWE